mgnify:CR=1 FL=1
MVVAKYAAADRRRYGKGGGGDFGFSFVAIFPFYNCPGFCFTVVRFKIL